MLVMIDGGVRVRVGMIVMVPVMMAVCSMSVRMLVRVDMDLLRHVRRHRFLSDDTELRGADPRTNHRLRPDRIARNSQTAERTADVLERNARVDQRAEHHVAGRAREAIEVENPHNRSILPGYQASPRGNCPASMNE